MPPAPSGGLRRLRGTYWSVTGPELERSDANVSDLVPLVVAAKAGDHGAFDQLVAHTWPSSWGLALRMMGNEDDARDVLQDAYLRAFRGLRRFRGDARFSTWMYRIVANCAATALTRRGRHRHAQLGDGSDDDLDVHVPIDDHPDRNPELAGIAASERARVQAALETLPDGLRAVVVLRDVYDLPHEAIAAHLGISETAAKVRLHRARKKLRATLFPTRGDDLQPLDGDVEACAS